MFQTAHLQIPSRSWTKAALLSHLQPEQVFDRLGCPVDEPLGTRFCSPFREDRSPDCKLYCSPRTGTLYFYDPSHELHLDWISLVQYAQDKDYSGALEWVAKAFNLEDAVPLSDEEQQAVNKLNAATRTPKAPSVIQIKARPWNKSDLGYWNSFNIGERELLVGRVFPISDYWLNGQHRRAPAMSYAYQEKDGVKLYFPQEKQFRFLSTTKALSCYELLPQKGALLVITSSKKDALCLMSFGYQAIAPQGEGHDIDAHILWELRMRFKCVVIFYDNDYPGLKLAHSKWLKWQVNDYLFLPFDEEAKDPAAYTAKYGAVTAADTLTNLLTPYAS